MTRFDLAATTPLAWVAAAATVAAFAGAAALELRRGRAGRGWRLALLALACTAAFLLATEPRRWATLAPREAILLTPGATARDLAAAASQRLTTWSLPSSAGEPAPPPAPRLPDVAALARQHPEVTAVRVIGHGLAPTEWPLLRVPATAAPPPPLPFGLAAASWPRQLRLGDGFDLRVTAAGLPPDGATVSLRGAPIDDARARVTPAAPTATLRALPHGPGRHLLALRLEAPGQPPREEPIDVEVTAASPPAVLWLEGAPGPESRALARWLQASDGRLGVRTTVSRGIARQAFTGMPAMPLVPLSDATLARFDLVVTDARALAALAPAEADALATAVRHGLGLLLRAGDAADAGAPSPLAVRFPTRALSGASEIAARLQWEDGSVAAPLTLPPRALVAAPALVALAHDVDGELLAAWQPLGAGRVGVSLVDGTYRWQLEGHGETHRRLWRTLFAALARPAVTGNAWAPPAGPALVDLPLALRLRTTDAHPSARAVEAMGNAVALALRQDADDPQTWTTTWWPRMAGWVRLESGATTSPLWIAPASAWSTWRLAERQRATAFGIAAGTSTGGSAWRASSARVPVPLPVPVLVPGPLPRWPFFLAFVAALAVLWADEALRPANAGRPPATTPR